MTIAEKILWQKLRNNQVNGLKFRRQHPVDIFILDFYCHERKLAIEVDGGIHIQIDQKEWDENRTFELNELGIKVLRFTNDEVIYGIREVIDSIRSFLESNDCPIHPQPFPKIGKGVWLLMISTICALMNNHDSGGVKYELPCF